MNVRSEARKTLGWPLAAVRLQWSRVDSLPLDARLASKSNLAAFRKLSAVANLITTANGNREVRNSTAKFTLLPHNQLVVKRPFVPSGKKPPERTPGSGVP